MRCAPHQAKETLLRCGERAASICVVLDSKKSSTYCSEYASGFLEPAAFHLPAASSPRERFVEKSHGRHVRAARRARSQAVHQVLLAEASALLISRMRLRSISATSSALTLRMRPPCASLSKSALTLSLVIFEGSA